MPRTGRPMHSFTRYGVLFYLLDGRAALADLEVYVAHEFDATPQALYQLITRLHKEGTVIRTYEPHTLHLVDSAVELTEKGREQAVALYEKLQRLVT